MRETASQFSHVWPQFDLPVHLLGLTPLLGSVGSVAGEIKLRAFDVVGESVQQHYGKALRDSACASLCRPDWLCL